MKGFITMTLNYRDAEIMYKTAEQIDEYVKMMRINCEKISSSLALAEPYLSDDQSKKASTKIETYSTDLIKGLEEAMEASKKPRDAARALTIHIYPSDPFF
jgi:ribosome recycling factor